MELPRSAFENLRLTEAGNAQTKASQPGLALDRYGYFSKLGSLLGVPVIRVPYYNGYLKRG